jgi:Plasmid pRiA4b ORF-3-like protein
LESQRVSPVRLRIVKIYRIRIAPERAPNVYRVCEVSARHTLHDVHGVIQQAFGLSGDHSHVFYMSGRHWDKASEVEGPDTWGGRGRTPRTRLYELALEVGRQFAYVFDLREELWHMLVVQAVFDSEEPPAEPRLVESVGDAPPRPGAKNETEDAAQAAALSSLLPLANELVALFPARPRMTMPRMRTSSASQPWTSSPRRCAPPWPSRPDSSPCSKAMPSDC